MAPGDVEEMDGVLWEWGTALQEAELCGDGAPRGQCGDGAQQCTALVHPQPRSCSSPAPAAAAPGSFLPSRAGKALL